MNSNKKINLKNKISNLVKKYSDLEFGKKKFIPGKTTIPPTGKVIGNLELQNMVEASLDGWLTAGRFNKNFEETLSKFIGICNVPNMIPNPISFVIISFDLYFF